MSVTVQRVRVFIRPDAPTEFNAELIMRRVMGDENYEEMDPNAATAFAWTFKGLYAELWPSVLQAAKNCGLSNQAIDEIRKTIVLQAWTEVSNQLWNGMQIYVGEEG